MRARNVHPRPHARLLSLLVLATICTTAAAAAWRDDPAWDSGRAEWAVYDAERTIYGVPRRYEATIYTNAQHMDPHSAVKTERPQDPDAVAVFKHNVSEIIPTEHYTYRFLTTSFVRRDTLAPFALVASSQEDCGTSFKRLTFAGGLVHGRVSGYFPGEGERTVRFDAPAADASPLALHDALALTLRDYPFDDPPESTALSLIADQTDNHLQPLEPAPATVRMVGRERITVPWGTVETHHLRVSHAPHGGADHSDYWFAADPSLRHVLVRYEGPFGVRYELKRLGWWAYWDRDAQPEEMRSR